MAGAPAMSTTTQPSFRLRIDSIRAVPVASSVHPGHVVDDHFVSVLPDCARSDPAEAGRTREE
jgi:hypothetical protein